MSATAVNDPDLESEGALRTNYLVPFCPRRASIKQKNRVLRVRRSHE
jgi:hypothetical protein